MARRFGVSSVEPTATLQRVADEFPGVSLGVDPLREVSDFINIPESFTEEEVGKVSRRLKHYGYRMDTLSEGATLLDGLREMDEDSYQEIQEALDEMLGCHMLPARLVEHLLLMEEVSMEVLAGYEKALDKVGVPRGVGEAIEVVHDYLFSSRGMGLSDDASVDDIAQALEAVWRRYRSDTDKKLGDIQKKLGRTYKPVEKQTWIGRVFRKLFRGFRLHPVLFGITSFAAGVTAIATSASWFPWVGTALKYLFGVVLPGLGLGAMLALLGWYVAKWLRSPSAADREIMGIAEDVKEHHLSKRGRIPRSELQ